MKLLLSILLFFSFLLFSSCSDDNNTYSINKLSEAKVSILRDKVTKNVTFIIDQTTQSWKLYAGNSISSIDQSKSILDGTGSGTYSLNLSNSSRSYFQLVTSDGLSTYFAESLLPIEGGYNFRDLGGIKTSNNKTIKWGTLFRSGDLSSLNQADITYMSSIDIITQVDFRSLQEIESAPNKRLPTSKNIYELSISFGNLNYDLSTLEKSNVDSILIRQNIQLVSDSIAIDNYRKFFQLLQNKNNLPLIYNCTAGKDRTGMATALILYALDVNEEVIFNNYLESNKYIVGKYDSYIAAYPFLKPLYEVRTEYLSAGINYIKNKYGTVDNYLVTVLNVDLNKMKEIYLY